jgi:hypothetical protein
VLRNAKPEHCLPKTQRRQSSSTSPAPPCPCPVPLRQCPQKTSLWHVLARTRSHHALIIPKAEICDADHIIQRIVGFVWGWSGGLACRYGKAFAAWAVPGVLSY